MLSAIAFFDFVVGACALIALMTGQMQRLPLYHRIPVAIISAGLMAQLAIDIGGVDRIRYPLWFLKDLGFSLLVVITIFRSLKATHSPA